VLSEFGNISAACRLAKVPPRTFYDRRDNDPAFAALVKVALAEAVDELEMTAIRLAKKGNVKLLMFLLQANRRKYRKRQEVTHRGKIRHTVTAEELSDDDLARIATDGTPPAELPASGSGAAAPAPGPE
jgi:hypothetical protein